MFREEILARKKKYFVTFQERKWHSNVPLAHVPWWHCSTIYHHFKIPCYSKGPSINNVGPFFRFYDPPPSPLVVFLLSKFRYFWPPTLHPPLRRCRLWMAPNNNNNNLNQIYSFKPLSVLQNMQYTFIAKTYWIIFPFLHNIRWKYVLHLPKN